MKLSRNVSITLDEAKKKARHLIQNEVAPATATSRAWNSTVKGYTLKLTQSWLQADFNHSKLGTGAEQKRNTTIRTLKNII